VKFTRPLFIAIFVLIMTSFAFGSASSVSVESPSTTEERVSLQEVKEVGTTTSNLVPAGPVVTADDMSFKILGSARSADDIFNSGKMFNTELEQADEDIVIELKIECQQDSTEICSISQFNFQYIGDEGTPYDAEWFVTDVKSVVEGEGFNGEGWSIWVVAVHSKDN